jgi:hypothetical protein
VLTRLLSSVAEERYNRPPQCASLNQILELPGTLTSSVHFNYVC